MDAVVMCGGRGTRLDADVEKPLFAVGDEPMIDSVLRALAASGVDRTYAAVSPHTPRTAAHVPCPTIETPGEGYVADLQSVLADERLTGPVLTVAADLPLLDAAVVDDVLANHVAGSTTVAVPVFLKRVLGVSVDTTFETAQGELAPTGVNVVGDGPDETLVRDDERLAVNVNRTEDAAVAERLLD